MKKQIWLFGVLTSITVAWMFIMRPFTPSNIVAFEFARTADQALSIFKEWGTYGMEKARLSIYLDFIFLVLYSLSFNLGCKIVARFVNNRSIAKPGLLLAHITWVAGACDFMENISLLVVLQKINEGWLGLLSGWRA